MARRVGTLANINQEDDILRGLSFIRSLSGEDQDLDLTGTSSEPIDYLSQVGPPQFGDVRQNDTQYVDNLKKIAQLSPQPFNPPALREEQMEGLSGMIGAEESKDKWGGFNSRKQGPYAALPENKYGNLSDPLESIRQMVKTNPSLLDQLPEETRGKLLRTQEDANRPFLAGAQEGQPPIPGDLQEDIPLFPNMDPNQRPGDELLNPVLEEARQLPPVVPSDQSITEQMVYEYPNQELKPGAVEQVEGDNKLMSDLTALSKGIIPPEQLQMAKEWQDISGKQMNLLDAEQRALLTKAESGKLSTFEKIALGIAIAAPILIGLRYGGGAVLAGLGEGLSSFGKNQAQMGDKEGDKIGRLQQIQKEKLANQEKNIDVNKKIIDSIPDKAARGFLGNKEIRKIGNKTGISTGDEGEALWLDAAKFDKSDEGVKRAREVIKEADDTIGIMKDSNTVVDDLLDIMDELPSNTNIWDAISKSLQGITPLTKGPQIEVQGPDGKVRKVDALAQIKQKISLLQDLYNKQILGGTRLTGNVVNHWGGILGDPTRVKDWFSQDLNSFKDTARSLKDIMNSREVESLVGKGFLREPLQAQFPFGNNRIVRGDENRLNELRQMSPEELQKKVK